MLRAAHRLIFKRINSLLTCLSHDVSSGRVVPLARLPSKHKCVPWLLLAAAVPTGSLDPGTPWRMSCAMGWDGQAGSSSVGSALMNPHGPNLPTPRIGTKETFVFVSCEVS